MVNPRATGQEAPGELERVRLLLNSWLIPNDTRVPADRFDDFAREHALPPTEAAAVRELRDDLRTAIEQRPAADDRLNRWAERLGLRPVVMANAVGFVHSGRFAGDILAIAFKAIVDGQWSRLKTCPDCRWAFYDRTRNGSKRWCLMYAGGPDGRACGTIAKVRRHRARRPSTS